MVIMNSFDKQLIITIIITLFIHFTKSQSLYNGPATIDYFQQHLHNNLSITNLPELTCINPSTALYGFVDLNIYDGMDYYFGQTNTTNPVQYYKLSITSQMKELYTSSLYVSSCCDLDPCKSFYQLNNSMPIDLCNQYLLNITHKIYNKALNITHSNTYQALDINKFCGNTSLDTYLYILQEKKGQLNLIYMEDDSSCSNPQKSSIDLLHYKEGDYIVAVGGYAQEYGSYYLQLSCIQYSYPIQKEQFNPPQNTIEITCNKSINDQTIMSDPVNYYTLNINKNTYFPIVITSTINITSTDQYAYVTMYLIQSTSANNYIGNDFKIVTFSQTGKNQTGHIIIDNDKTFTSLKSDTTKSLQKFPFGTYYVVVQGEFNLNSNYEIYMECAPSPTMQPTINPTKYPSSPPTISPTIPPTTAPKISRDMMIGLVFGSCGLLFILFVTYYIYECVQYRTTKTKNESKTKLHSFSTVNNEQELKDTTIVYHVDECGQQAIEESEEMKSKQVTIRRYDSDRNVAEQLEKNEDMIQLVLAHTIKCAEDQDGFDIYQLLACRYYDKDSRKVVGKKPFSWIGINIELIKLSSFFEASFVAFVIALTQTYGMTVVVHRLISSYFEQGIDEETCSMDAQRWRDVFSLKMLSFLLSLVITFYIGILLSGIRHNGLYEIMHRLSLKHIKRIDNIGIWVLQIGQAINYYVCALAIIGSYFIIFSSNKGDDYAQSALDMILNAVALFFMLELDDMMVSDQDYDDCADHLSGVLKNYIPDLRINQQYIDVAVDNFEKDISIDDHEENAVNKCSLSMMTFMYHAINVFSVIITICCYFGGFVAPFVIFFCW